MPDEAGLCLADMQFDVASNRPGLPDVVDGLISNRLVSEFPMAPMLAVVWLILQFLFLFLFLFPAFLLVPFLSFLLFQEAQLVGVLFFRSGSPLVLALAAVHLAGWQMLWVILLFDPICQQCLFDSIYPFTKKEGTYN